MRDFQTLIRDLLDRRFSGNESRLAEVLGVNRSSVHRVATGEKALSLKAIDAWADALGIEGQERADFVLAVEVANSPESISKRINALEAMVERNQRQAERNLRTAERNEREATNARAKLAKVLAELRAERAPRPRGR